MKYQLTVVNYPPTPGTQDCCKCKYYNEKCEWTMPAPCPRYEEA